MFSRKGEGRKTETGDRPPSRASQWVSNQDQRDRKGRAGFSADNDIVALRLLTFRGFPRETCGEESRVQGGYQPQRPPRDTVDGREAAERVDYSTRMIADG